MEVNRQDTLVPCFADAVARNHVTISSKVKSKLIANSQIKARDIDVSSSQGVVTLIGRVSTQIIKDDAERTARGTKGVKGVTNELHVGRVKT